MQLSFNQNKLTGSQWRDPVKNPLELRMDVFSYILLGKNHGWEKSCSLSLSICNIMQPCKVPVIQMESGTSMDTQSTHILLQRRLSSFIMSVLMGLCFSAWHSGCIPGSAPVVRWALAICHLCSHTGFLVMLFVWKLNTYSVTDIWNRSQCQMPHHLLLHFKARRGQC